MSKDPVARMRELHDLDKPASNDEMMKTSNDVTKVRINFELDEETHTELKQYCAKHKVSIRDAVTGLIREMLSRERG